MTIVQIAIVAVVAILIGRLSKGRQLSLLAVSTFVIFWLQPNEPFVILLFWLPVATVGITVLTWALTSEPEMRSWKQNWPSLAVVFGVVILMDLNRIFRLDQIYTTNTPSLPQGVAALIGIAVIAFMLARGHEARRWGQAVAFSGIILVFIVLKTPALSKGLIDSLSALKGENAVDKTFALTWLGFSYTAFRLLHTIRDRQSGRLPAVTLAEYVNYIIFFPSFTAGPIDRIERFVRELRTPLPLGNADWLDAGSRLFVGLFKKFVVADFLAIISLSDVLVAQVKSPIWMWVFLYAYAFRIYFDFSGYTDIAIGVARLMGIRLPENFTAPYLKPNLTQFWNSWHISLTQWFRTYFFNPVTRALRGRDPSLPVWIIIFVTQTSTMVLIGLWHGVTAGFALWGLWHGLGLFIQNRWSDFTRNRIPLALQAGRGQALLRALSVVLTFNFVALGWLFFNLSTPAIAWLALLKLFGLA
jgi:alginate O-acetyltransferase complex protein AlgI